MPEKPAAPVHPLAVVPPASGAPGRPHSRLAQHRVAARAAAARLVGLAAASTSSLAAVGRALDVDTTAVQHWADPEHPAAMTLGDVLACGYGPKPRREFARAVLLAAQASLDEVQPDELVAPERAALRVAAGAGAFAAELDEALAAGEIDDDERRRLDEALVQLSLRLEHARRALRRGAGR
jgi:hypothetical protein